MKKTKVTFVSDHETATYGTHIAEGFLELGSGEREGKIGDEYCSRAVFALLTFF